MDERGAGAGDKPILLRRGNINTNIDISLCGDMTIKSGEETCRDYLNNTPVDGRIIKQSAMTFKPARFKN